MNYDYFDADYFQNGHKKGTVYNNYLEVARSAEIYKEISRLIHTVFRPRRALEIGCATGVVVKHLNELGTEAHGIDVSSWAVENREHYNVLLAGAENLPFPEGHFDFIYSVHSLEHIPENLKIEAFSELKRVSGPAVHFHMMPIVGEGPYSGERETVRSRLRKDPTHSLLEDMTWWRKQFEEIGFDAVNASLSFAHESGTVDLGVSQVLCANYNLNGELFDRIRNWNAYVVNELRSNYHSARLGAHIPVESPWRDVTLTMTGEWNDVVFEPANLVIGRASVITAKVSIFGDEGSALRFCFVTEDGAEADLWREFPPGTSVFSFHLSDFFSRIGSIAQSPIRRIYFGGVARSDASVALSISENGRSLFST
ncbi:class I SAM-dependent methyltransferase [Rhizobium sp. GR12]|uniref:class I SAM-dependent methyltransferase n=1 Tax=Rhizobium sp. GR12 TaxID=3053925 RepID=UPI002FBD4742